MAIPRCQLLGASVCRQESLGRLGTASGQGAWQCLTLAKGMPSHGQKNMVLFVDHRRKKIINFYLQVSANALYFS
jgi:hypothetical protein